MTQAAEDLATHAAEAEAEPGGRRVPTRSREAPQDTSQSEGDTRPSLGEPVTKALSTHI